LKCFRILVFNQQSSINNFSSRDSQRNDRRGYIILVKQVSIHFNVVLRSGAAMATIQLAINGKSYNLDTDPQTSLLTVLREHLDLTGSKYGCGEGQCGACTVLIEGKAQRSCITRVGSVGQKQITTIEGLAQGNRLHPVQQAFLDAGAMQCAYCTSGMIMSAVALLQKNPNPQPHEIVEFMDGNICRCGTYPRIISAIQKAAQASRKSAVKGAAR
jgi:nicotinate dehydrogenase subunit A